MLALSMEHGHGARRGVGGISRSQGRGQGRGQGQGRATTTTTTTAAAVTVGASSKVGSSSAVASPPRLSPTSGRPLPRGAPPLNIRQKISQWEGLSQAEDIQASGVGGGVKGHSRGGNAPLRRELSSDALGNGVRSPVMTRHNHHYRADEDPRGKATLSKAKSLGLDFREDARNVCSSAIGRKMVETNTQRIQTISSPRLQDRGGHTGLGNTASCAPVLSPSPTRALKVIQLKTPILFTEASPSNGVQTGVAAQRDSDLSPLPPLPPCPASPAPSLEDPEDRLPPGNFYTSRGFWKQLEASDSLWDKHRDASLASGTNISGSGTGTFRGFPFTDEVPAPPKPQRTFQYRGTAGSDSNAANCGNQWDCQVTNRTRTARGRVPLGPPSCPPPPCPVLLGQGNGFSRHKKNRKSFEFEDVSRLASQQGSIGSSGGSRRSGLYHARSEDSIYEDIIPDASRENPYEDVKLSPMCLPISRPRPWTIAQRQRPLQTPKLPPKPLTLRAFPERPEKGPSKPTHTLTPTATATATTPKRSVGTRACRLPQYVVKIHEVFQTKRGWKRVKSQGTARDEASGTESDPDDGSKDGLHRLVYKQSTLRRRPGYRTLEKDLIQLQQQQLFQLFVVVSLRKAPTGNTYSPVVTQQFPTKFEKSSRLSREAEDRLKVIPLFCFPDSQDWKPSADGRSETFSFVLTGEDGSRWFGYCRKILPVGKGKRLPEVHCIVSRLGCFNLFAKILVEVERRREISPALVYPFMRSVMEAPFPAPGRTITVKSFLPGSGNEVLTLCRPVDSRLEHVDFDSLLECLSVAHLLQVFASLLLERRVIFIADKLSTLSRSAHSALALLYPFTWQHTFVPVLPASMLDISCSPTPFLMGALSPSLPELLELPIEEVLIVDLSADKFVRQLGDEDCILPSKLQAALHEILEGREQLLSQEEADRSTGEECDLSSLISEAFVRFFVELVGHYPLHMSEAEAGGARELHRDNFRKSHPSRGARQFLQLFMDTQMFAGFIQDRELRKGVKGLFEMRTAEYLDSQPEPEPSVVNKFFKEIGNKMKFLQKK
ncbi:DENN domain-containing protein 2C [Engraulis encrasicolus]|uniref:DENN domain-containing protein 2C n=1 Tax=Engraulis encrasicolus TaxID=184585 RepID=UPI002FD34976